MSEPTPALPLVEMKSITKDFPSVRALDNVSIAFRPGEVHGLIGENGAGKSTLMRILCGVKTPSTGELLLRGEPVRLNGPADAQRRGISMIHQELNVVGELSVAENILLGHEPVAGGLIRRSQMEAKARELLDGIGCRLDPWRLVKHLSIAEQQMVEIAKALSHQAEVLIMDEPTAVLTQHEVGLLMTLIRDLRRRGAAIIYISHILPEVLAICDRVTVLRDGKLGKVLEKEEISPAEIIRLMIGHKLDETAVQHKLERKDGKVVLEVRGLTAVGKFQDLSFDLHEGEVLGIGGLVGSGRTELVRALYEIGRASCRERV